MTKVFRNFMIVSGLFLFSLITCSTLFAQQNLIAHGNFDDNIRDFDTDYEYSYGLGGDGDTGKYYLGNNAHNNSSSMFTFYDHTTGSGQQRYMIVNGHTQSNKLVWGMTINVQAHSYYDLSMWITNLSPGGGSSLTPWMKTKLRIKINGETLLDNWLIPNVSQSNGIWNQVPVQHWYSANSTTATIQIYDLCTSDNGNDFGLDDISFTYLYSNIVEANDDEYTTCFETPVTINPMDNDVINPSFIAPDVHFSLMSQPSHGSLSLVSGTTYVYTPNTNYSGPDTFSYKLTYGTNDITKYGIVSITVNARPQRTINQHACESFTWTGGNGQTYTQNGQYSYVKPNPSGCDSLLILNLTIHHDEEETLPAVEECDSYTWHGTTYTQSGTYDYQTTTQWDCVRIEHLPLTIHYGDTLDIPVSACESYTWHGQTYTQSGVYTYVTTNSFGCSRLERLQLTISDEFRHVDTRTECDEYYWPRKNITYHQSVMDSVTVPGPQGGCDSTFVLNLTIHYGDTLDLEPVSACDSYEWHGQTYTTSGIKTYWTTNDYGCDRLERLNLTINHSENIELPEISVCDEFQWHGQTYTQSGLLVFDTVNQYGCDVQYTLPLTVHHGDTIDWDPVTECDSYLWYGQTITESGQYSHMSTTPQGCDRLERIYVTINHSTIDTLAPVTACDSYEWHGQEYTQTGYCTYVGEGPTGCPHTEVLLLTINHSSENEFYVTSCESYEWYGNTYTEPGVYYHQLTNSQGCDSMLIMHLEIGEMFELEESATGCESYEWHGTVYSESGDYEYLSENPSGCDSLFTLHLTIAPNYESDMDVEECYSYTWIDQVYQESGDYPRHFTAVTGCDSLVVLHLTIKEAVHHEFEQQTCLPYTWNGITYYYDGYYDQTFEASNGCDSIATMHLVFSEAMTSEFDRVACDAVVWEGQLCDHNGDYHHTYQSLQGCDSIVTMHFSLADVIEQHVDTVACDPFDWYGHHFEGDGQSSHTFQTLQGCDSTVYLNVTFNQAEIQSNSVSACNSYVVDGVVYDQPGFYQIYYDTVYSPNGCIGSVQLLNLTINDSELMGAISGSANVFVASNIISGIYRYEVDAAGVEGDIIWTISNPDWQIVEAQDYYCLVFVGTPGSATLTARFNTTDCGEMEREFIINAGFFDVNEQAFEVKVFPNPTKGTVTVEAEGIEAIRLTNMMGQVLDSRDYGRSDSVMLNLTGYAPSVYLIEIKTVNGLVKKRLVLCR